MINLCDHGKEHGHCAVRMAHEVVVMFFQSLKHAHEVLIVDLEERSAGQTKITWTS